MRRKAWSWRRLALHKAGADNMCLKCVCALLYYLAQSAVLVVLPFLFVPVQNVNLAHDLFFSHGLYFVGGILVVATLPLGLLEITQHWMHLAKPHLQNPIIRILWLVPIWTTTSWIGLWFPDYAITLDTCRECYESYAIYQFTVLMSNYLHTELDLGQELARQPPVPHWLALRQLIAPWYKGRPMLQRCKGGILQYAVVRVVTTIIALNCELKSVYKYANQALLLLNLSSKGIVVYSLMFFYFAHAAELQPMKPLPKLLCIKFVVFFSFLINVTVMILLQTGGISQIVVAQSDLKATTTFHDFLICVEMLMATVAFNCVFRYTQYAPPATGTDLNNCNTSRDDAEKHGSSSRSGPVEDQDEPLLSYVY